MKLELKQVSGQVNPIALQILKDCLKQFDSLNAEKEAELEEFVEEHCEKKFMET